MAGTKSKSRSPKKLVTKQRILVLVGLLLLAILLVSGIKMYNHRQAQNKQFTVDQANFAQAEKDMAGAYDAVVQQIGQPYETKIDKSCGYVALKFNRGPLTCGITYRINYQISDRILNIPVAVQVYNVISSSKGYSKNNYDDPLKTLDDAQEPDAFMTDIDGPGGFSCSVNYRAADIDLYNSQKQTLHFSKDLSTTLMAEYTFGCGSGAVRPLYDLTDK